MGTNQSRLCPISDRNQNLQWRKWSNDSGVGNGKNTLSNKVVLKWQTLRLMLRQRNFHLGSFGTIWLNREQLFLNSLTPSNKRRRLSGEQFRPNNFSELIKTTKFSKHPNKISGHLWPCLSKLWYHPTVPSKYLIFCVNSRVKTYFSNESPIYPF